MTVQKHIRLTYEQLSTFLSKFEPVSIAWKLMVTNEGISALENDYVFAHSIYNVGARNKDGSVRLG